MKCPYCETEMERGVVQSARQMFFTKEPHSVLFVARKNKDVVISHDNFTCPSCYAYICRACKKVIIEY